MTKATRKTDLAQRKLKMTVFRKFSGEKYEKYFRKYNDHIFKKKSGATFCNPTVFKVQSISELLDKEGYRKGKSMFFY